MQYLYKNRYIQCQIVNKKEKKERNSNFKAVLIETQRSLRAENNKAIQVLLSNRSRDGRGLPGAVITPDHFSRKRSTRSSAPAA